MSEFKRQIEIPFTVQNRNQLKNDIINEYVKKLYEIQELNNEIYAFTELFEHKRMIDYNFDLFNIFKNKINYYSRIGNQILKLRDEEIRMGEK